MSLKSVALEPINLTKWLVVKPSTFPVIVVVVPTDAVAVIALAVCHVLPEGKVKEIAKSEGLLKQIVERLDVSEMKHKKLRLKDEIVKLERESTDGKLL